MKSITGVIESVELKKQGNTNGKAWSIFELFVDGKKMSTFDAEYQDHIGENTTIFYEERENNGFVNLTAKDFGWKPSEKDTLLADLVGQVADLVTRVEALEGIVRLNVAPANPLPTETPKVEAPANPASADKIDIDDIQF